MKISSNFVKVFASVSVEEPEYPNPLMASLMSWELIVSSANRYATFGSTVKPFSAFMSAKVSIVMKTESKAPAGPIAFPAV